MGRIGRIFTVVGLLLLGAAWLWWLYAYRSVEAIECLYMPGASCALVESPVFALPPYEPMVLWAGAAAALLGAIIRVAAKA